MQEKKCNKNHDLIAHGRLGHA